MTRPPSADPDNAASLLMPEDLTPRFWNVPNTLTAVRFVLSIVIFALIANAFYFPALALFGIAALTDALDGYFARLLNQSTAIGRQLDPLVDKVIVCGCFIYLSTISDTGVQPWMVTAIVIRELLIQGLRSLLEGQGQAFGAKMAGKIKTTLQCLSISAVLFCLWIPPWPSWLWIRDILIWLSVILTLYSGLAYFTSAMPNLKASSSRSL